MKTSLFNNTYYSSNKRSQLASSSVIESKKNITSKDYYSTTVPSQDKNESYFINKSLTNVLLPEMPVHFYFNLTHRCNLSCIMCTQYGGKFKNQNPYELNVSEWEKLIEELSEFSPKITLFGGEPFLYSGIRDIFKLLKKYKCAAEIVTNGYVLEKYLEDLIECNIHLNISIDGTESIHNIIRGNNKSFVNIKKSLEKIQDFRKKSTDIEFNVNCVILPDNIENIYDFLEFIYDYSPMWITLQHLQVSSDILNKTMAYHWKKLLGIDYKTTLIPKKKYEFNQNYLERLNEVISTITNHSFFGNRILFLPNLNKEEIALYYSENQHYLLS